MTRFTIPIGLKDVLPKNGGRYAPDVADVRPEPDKPGSALVTVTDGKVMGTVSTVHEGLGGPVHVPRVHLPGRTFPVTLERDGDGDRFTVTPTGGKSPVTTVAICPADVQFPPCADIVPDASQYRPVCRVDVALLAKLAAALSPSDNCLTLLCRVDVPDSVKKPLIVLGAEDTVGVVMPITDSDMMSKDPTGAARSKVLAMRERIRRAFQSREERDAEDKRNAAAA